MDDSRIAQLPWLPDLMDRVRRQLAALDDAEPDRLRALHAEASQIDGQIKGWSQSLANPDLPSELRSAIETDWQLALARKREIDLTCREQACRQQTAEEVLSDEDVLARLERLGEVLAANNPTQGNLELSLHIDRIECWQSGKVTMRTCKLGALTGGVDLVADSAGEVASSEKDGPELPPSWDKTGPRRRTRLRVHDDGAGRAQIQAVADFAADPKRFADLGDEWFWVDEFELPAKQSWATEHAERVLARFEELKLQNGKKPSLNILATEFGTTRQTITATLKVAREGPQPGRRRQATELRHTGVDAKAMADEMALMWYQDLEVNEIVERTGAHRNTVSRILDDWHDEQGLIREDGRERRRRIREQRAA